MTAYGSKIKTGFTFFDEVLHQPSLAVKFDKILWCGIHVCDNWIFLWLEIANPKIWKSEFRYSEIPFFVLDYLSISMGILVKALPHLRCVAVFTNVSTEIMIRYAQKADIKSDFHITRQLMESHPKYSTSEQNVTKYISNIFYFFNYFTHQWILHCHFYSNIYNCATIPGLSPWAHQLFRHTILSITPTLV